MVLNGYLLTEVIHLNLKNEREIQILPKILFYAIQGALYALVSTLLHYIYFSEIRVVKYR